MSKGAFRIVEVLRQKLKTGILILIGMIFSLIGISVIAYNIENGDMNAISMYFVVFGMVAIGLGIVNGFYLKLVERKTQRLKSQIGLGSIPLIIFLGLLFSDTLRLTFISEFGLIGVGVTNLIWITDRIFTEHKKVNL